MKRSIILVALILQTLFFSESNAQITIFSENWTLNSFTTNGWSFTPAQSNWTMGAAYTPTGATSPTAYFNWSPTLTNYSVSLVSPIINGTPYMNMTLDYKLQLNNFSTATVEEFKIEYKSVTSATWTTLINYTSSGGSFNVAPTNQSLIGVNTSNFQLRFTANGPNSFNINGWGIDDIVVKGFFATPCSGVPTAGTTFLSSTCPTVLSVNGSSMFANINYQWQKKDACGGSWVNIPGATNMFYTINSQTNQTQYRLYNTCTNSNASDTSSSYTLASVAPCYCTSQATSTADEEILNVTIGNVLNNSSTCATTGGAGSIQSLYSNYTSLSPTILNKGQTYPFAVQIGTCGGTFNNSMAMYIDYDQNGTFDVPAERIYLSAAVTAGPHVESGTFTVPTTAVPGVTRLRVVNVETSPANINPCGNYTWGETEDYSVKILYTPSATGAGVYCSGANVTLSATAPGITGNYSFLWEFPNGTFSTDTTFTMNNIQVTNAGIYKLYVITYPCVGGAPDTSGAQMVSVAVNQTPPVPIISPNIVYCQNQVFDSIPVFGSGLKWYSFPYGGIGNTSAPIINTAVFGTVTYYVSQTISGCEGPRTPVSITVVPKPAPPSVVSPVVYCQGDTPSQLEAYGQNIRWYPIPSGGVGTPITPTPGTNAQGVYTWYVSQTIAGCESERIPVRVDVNYIPNAIIAISRPYVCQHDTISIKYFGNATTLADYAWTLPVGATVSGGSGQGPLVVRFDTAGIRRVKLQVDNGGCKGPETHLDIEVRALPQLSLDMQPDACVGEIVNLAIGWKSMHIDKYNWNFGGGQVQYGVEPSGPYGLMWNTPGIKTITVIATERDCNSLPVTDKVNVHALPNATITDVNAKSVCAGDSVLLEALYDPTHSYKWEPVQYFRADQTNREFAVLDKAGYVYLTVVNQYNCKKKDSLFINAEPCCKVVFPSAFSPNGDGKNDVFRMIKKGGTLSISTFRIVNRWGQTVFESADDRIGWDGTFNNIPQDMGTYHYFTRYKCADGNYYEEKGEFVLVR